MVANKTNGSDEIDSCAQRSDDRFVLAVPGRIRRAI
jgi:hypothetical protein